MQKHKEEAGVHRHRCATNNPVTADLRKDDHRPIRVVQIVIPLHNEADNIKPVTVDVLTSLKREEWEPRILLVDDGSTDGSKSAILEISVDYPEISYISLSRNFGKEAALMAGLREVEDGFDVLAYMDGDGQHQSADLVRMIHRADQSDADLICGVRADRLYQTPLQRRFSHVFYRLFHLLTEHSIEEGVGDFNVMRPKVVTALRHLQEEHPFMKGLVSWIGFRRDLEPITIENRAGGVRKSSTVRMLRLGLGAILSFSSWPLRAWSVIGAAIAGLSIVYLIFVLLKTLVDGTDVPGYATIVVLMLGFGGLQLLSIGIVGEYIARIYDASKDRPRYIISDRG
jgi:glycosyltransferase involved in cell wall biosynthesis